VGKKSIVVPPKGVKDVSINWTVTAGDHSILAKLENAKFLISTGKYEDVYLEENQTDTSERTVSKKITAKPVAQTAKEEPSKVTETLNNTFSNIEETISGSTPKFISVPILATTHVIESARESVAASSDSKKSEVNEAIGAIKKPNKEGNKSSPILKPLKYAELFLLTLLAFIFGQKIIFYGILLVILFYLLRYIYRLAF
jgi:hypothetical protein